MGALSNICCAASDCMGEDCLQLTERESLVCETVCASEQPLGFVVVKNSLGLHQEILSRILRRLVKHGAIEKVGRGYRRKVSQ